MMKPDPTPDQGRRTDDEGITEAPESEVDVEAIEVRTPTPEELGFTLPSDPDEAVDTLLRAVAEARVESAEHRDGHLRALAEMDNVRKRSLRDRVTFIDQATERMMHKLLPVLDSFKAGLDSPTETEVEQRLIEGLRQTYGQLSDALASEGLVPIEAAGQPFDPHLHEAVSIIGEGDNLVVQHQLRGGFRLKDRVLRPATVVVGPPEEAPEDV